MMRGKNLKKRREKGKGKTSTKIYHLAKNRGVDVSLLICQFHPQSNRRLNQVVDHLAQSRDHPQGRKNSLFIQDLDRFLYQEDHLNLQWR